MDIDEAMITEAGAYAYQLAEDLWLFNRSLTGEGVRATLKRLKEELPELQIKSIPSGSQVFDWQIPKEWKVHEAWIETPKGERIADFKKNNLHLLGYSTPVFSEIPLEDLDHHLYSLPDQPDAIPYVTSYYADRWGFCITHAQKMQLEPGIYKVHIDTEHFDGELNYGELIIPGRSENECLLSTYICHPSMANNELSGPVVAMALAKWLLDRDNNEYTYRFVFVPETIGSIAYLSKNLKILKERVKAGYVLTCIGDDRNFSYLSSRLGNTISDAMAKHCLRHLAPSHVQYSFLERGSDERQYCAPGIDLPIAVLMRTKYGSYPEYHTSLDTLGTVVTKDGLSGGFKIAQACLQGLEINKTYKTTVLGEPQLSKRGLYPSLGTKKSDQDVVNMMNLIAYSDGNHTLLEIADILNLPIWKLHEIVSVLVDEGLLEAVGN